MTTNNADTLTDPEVFPSLLVIPQSPSRVSRSGTMDSGCYPNVEEGHGDEPQTLYEVSSYGNNGGDGHFAYHTLRALDQRQVWHIDLEDVLIERQAFHAKLEELLKHAADNNGPDDGGTDDWLTPPTIVRDTTPTSVVIKRPRGHSSTKKRSMKHGHLNAVVTSNLGLAVGELMYRAERTLESEACTKHAGHPELSREQWRSLSSPLTSSVMRQGMGAVKSRVARWEDQYTCPETTAQSSERSDMFPILVRTRYLAPWIDHKAEGKKEKRKRREEDHEGRFFKSSKTTGEPSRGTGQNSQTLTKLGSAIHQDDDMEASSGIRYSAPPLSHPHTAFIGLDFGSDARRVTKDGKALASDVARHVPTQCFGDGTYVVPLRDSVWAVPTSEWYSKLHPPNASLAGRIQEFQHDVIDQSNDERIMSMPLRTQDCPYTLQYPGSSGRVPQVSVGDNTVVVQPIQKSKVWCLPVGTISKVKGARFI